VLSHYSVFGVSQYQDW